MSPLAHTSYPALTFLAAAKIFRIDYGLSDILVLIVAANVLDLDFFFYLIFRGFKKAKNAHHHQWFTHWPITYLPLLILLFIFPSFKLNLICYGIFTHLAMDTLFSSDGIKLLAPFSRRSFKFLSSKTKNLTSGQWALIYEKMLIFKIDVAATFIHGLLIAIDYIY
jgi:hypothetical protein